FFSSRRRHTRSKRDWSSDVCSSDLEVPAGKSDRLAVTLDITGAPREGLTLKGYAAKESLRVSGIEAAGPDGAPLAVESDLETVRSEERRVGKECRRRGAEGQHKKKA